MTGCGRRGAACLALMLALSGCVPILAAGAAGGGYALGGQERGIGTQVNDSAIAAEVRELWRQYHPDMASQLTATVYEGRVLVTGLVANPVWQEEGVRRAWQAKGVKEVYNEVRLAARSSFGADTNDAWITTRLRNALIFDANVKSVNYTIETSNGIVYLIGSARTQAELDRVTGHAREVPNVRKVVSYVRIRPGDSPREALPEAVSAPPAAPAFVPSPASPSGPALSNPAVVPAPRRAPGAVEVTPLS